MRNHGLKASRRKEIVDRAILVSRLRIEQMRPIPSIPLYSGIAIPIAMEIRTRCSGWLYGSI